MDLMSLATAADYAAGTALNGIKDDTPQVNGTIEANSGVMGIKQPFLRIRRNKDYNPSKQIDGLPSNSYVRLGSLKGYTRVKDVRVAINTATDNEKAEIESLLKKGVIL